MRELRGSEESGGRRFAIVASRFNEIVVRKLAEGALEGFRARGASEDDLELAWVPGSFELPLAARRLASSGRYAAVVCLGAVIRGETPHFDYVCEQAAAGIQRVALDSRIPIAFGVLTTDTVEQALARAGGDVGNKGYEGVVTVLETLAQLDRIART